MGTLKHKRVQIKRPISYFTITVVLVRSEAQNPRPSAQQTGALPTGLTRQQFISPNEFVKFIFKRLHTRVRRMKTVIKKLNVTEESATV